MFIFFSISIESYFILVIVIRTRDLRYLSDKPIKSLNFPQSIHPAKFVYDGSKTIVCGEAGLYVSYPELKKITFFRLNYSK